MAIAREKGVLPEHDLVISLEEDTVGDTTINKVPPLFLATGLGADQQRNKSKTNIFCLQLEPFQPFEGLQHMIVRQVQSKFCLCVYKVYACFCLPWQMSCQRTSHD